jgi:nucleotide-binding universal stress UspA family protein
MGGATVETPFTEILVPLDGSPAAERALAPALELVRRTGVPLRVLSRALPDEKETLASYLAGIADRHAAVTDIETQLVDRESIPDAITEGLGPSTLLCMSSHGHGGLARAVMGSIAEVLLRTLDRPTLIVGPHVTESVKIAGRIVACIDGSPESERTLEPARRWAAALDLPLWLMEVGEPGPPPEWITRGDVMESSHVAGLARRLGGVEGWDVLHDKDPAHALAGMATSATEPTALLVMATHGRTGWDRLRLGSVTTGTVHAATVPVLVVSAAPQPVIDAVAEVSAQRMTQP